MKTENHADGKSRKGKHPAFPNSLGIPYLHCRKGFTTDFEQFKVMLLVKGDTNCSPDLRLLGPSRRDDNQRLHPIDIEYRWNHMRIGHHQRAVTHDKTRSHEVQGWTACFLESAD